MSSRNQKETGFPAAPPLSENPLWLELFQREVETTQTSPKFLHVLADLQPPSVASSGASRLTTEPHFVGERRGRMRNRLALRIRNVVTRARWFRFLSLGMTVIVAVFTGLELESTETSETSENLLDNAALSFFVVELILKLLAEGDSVSRFFWDPDEGVFNCVDAAVVVGSLYGSGRVNGGTLHRFAVLRAVRFCRLVQPYQRSLVQGVRHGLCSAAGAFLLLLLAVFLAAVLCVPMLGQNDPASFGNLRISVVSLSRVAMLTSWSPLAYTAIFGCDRYDGGGYSSDVDGGGDDDDATTTTEPARIDASHGGGSLQLWRCTDPSRKLSGPGAAEAFFVLFTVLCAFLMTGLITASIAISMLTYHCELSPKATTTTSASSRATAAAKKKKLQLLATGNGSVLEPNVDTILSDSPVDRELLQWDIKDEDGRWCREVSLTWLCFRLASWIRFRRFMALALFADAVAVAFEVDPHASQPSALAVHFAALLLFAFELLVRVWACGVSVSSKGYQSGPVRSWLVQAWAFLALWVGNWRRFLMAGFWNVLDVVVVVMGTLQFSLPIKKNEDSAFVLALSLLRVLRVSRALRDLFPRMHALMRALGRGLLPCGLVLAQLAVLNYVLVCLGVICFAANDPFHFGTLRRAALSVWRIETGDEWDQILGINMYGCAQYPLGYPILPSSSSPRNTCDEEGSVAHGYWAFAYVGTVAVLGGLVLPGVLVGVLCVTFSEAWGVFVEKQLSEARLVALAAILKQQEKQVARRGDSVSDEVRSTALWWDAEREALIHQTFAMLDTQGTGALPLDEAQAFFHYVLTRFVVPPTSSSSSGAGGGGDEDEVYGDDDEEEGEEEAVVLPAAQHPAVLRKVLAVKQVEALRELFHSNSSHSGGGSKGSHDKGKVGGGLNKAEFCRVLRLAFKHVGGKQRENLACVPDKDLDAAFEIAATTRRSADRVGSSYDAATTTTAMIEQEAFVALCWRSLEGDLLGVSSVRGADAHAQGRRRSLGKWVVAERAKEGSEGVEEGGQSSSSPSSPNSVVPAAYHPAVSCGALSVSQVEMVRRRFRAAAAAPMVGERRGSAFEKSGVLDKERFRQLLRTLFEESGEAPLKLVPNSDFDMAFKIAATHPQITQNGSNKKSEKGGGFIEQEPFVVVFWRALEGDMVGLGGAKAAKEKVKNIVRSLGEVVGRKQEGGDSQLRSERRAAARQLRKHVADLSRCLECNPATTTALNQAAPTISGTKSDSTLSLPAFVAFFVHAKKVKSKLHSSGEFSETSWGEVRRQQSVHRSSSVKIGGGVPGKEGGFGGQEMKDEQQGAAHETESHKVAVEAQHELDALKLAQLTQATKAQEDEAAAAAATALAVEVAKAQAERDAAVAVDEACSEAWDHVLAGNQMNEELWQSSIEMLFMSFDKDGSGEIDVDELGNGLRVVIGHSLTPAQLHAFRENVDEDGNGRISCKEFLQAATWEKRKRDCAGGNNPDLTPTKPQPQPQPQQQQQQQLQLIQQPPQQQQQPQAHLDHAPAPSFPLPAGFEARAGHLLEEAGLAEYMEALAGAHILTCHQLDVADDAALGACGMRKMHVKKLRKAVFSARLLTGSSMTSSMSSSSGSSVESVKAPASPTITRGRIRADAGSKFKSAKASATSTLSHKAPAAAAGSATSRLAQKSGPAGMYNKTMSAADRLTAGHQRKVDQAAAREDRRRTVSQQRTASKGRPATTNQAKRPGPSEKEKPETQQRPPSPSDYISPASPRQGSYL